MFFFGGQNKRRYMCKKVPQVPQVPRKLGLWQLWQGNVTIHQDVIRHKALHKRKNDTEA